MSISAPMYGPTESTCTSFIPCQAIAFWHLLNIFGGNYGHHYVYLTLVFTALSQLLIQTQIEFAKNGVVPHVTQLTFGYGHVCTRGNGPIFFDQSFALCVRHVVNFLSGPTQWILWVGSFCSLTLCGWIINSGKNLSGTFTARQDCG